MAEGQRRRKERCDKGQVQITERDIDALLWIGEQYAARFDQLQTVLGRQAGRGAHYENWISMSAVRLVANRWISARLVEVRKITALDPPWVWLTAQGLRQFHLPYKVYVPTLGSLAHLFAINEVRLILEWNHPAGRWESERSLRAGLVHRKGERFPHLPDGEFGLKGQIIAIEVERSPKKPEELLENLEELTACYAQVWYYATRKTRSGLVEARTRLLPDAQKRLKILTSPTEDGGEKEA
ncbi:MAG TPA: hypothetical protein VKV37_10420 [Ktedonobacteraceae bacterium]|jgi:hypothetical protein|nr:hypothetical protein [Ktedonobacteraceae bacterium]